MPWPAVLKRVSASISYHYNFCPQTVIHQLRSTMSGGQGVKTNRLVSEKSPYLLQHSTNPVDWYPWGDEAIEVAKAQNKPIFLSVGYSTCHWCHVMERESFEDEAVAALLNKHFVNVKVDREERPDVDQMYMTFIQALGAGGGWPMSVWVTPSLQPFYGGTYFPPDDTHGRPSFSTVINIIADKWENSPEELNVVGNQFIYSVKESVEYRSPGRMPRSDLFDHALAKYSKVYDAARGGFGKAPKFPQVSQLNFMLRCWHHMEIEPCLSKVKQTLAEMSRGGIRDHVGNGFHRYSVDGEWHVPHFEKMLYDQSQLLSLYSDVFVITKDEEMKKVGLSIIDYVSRDLRHPDGGFFSAEDADSLPCASSAVKLEGAFCVWEMSEIVDGLSGSETSSPAGPVKLIEVFCYHYDVRENGNVNPTKDPHGELSKKNVLRAVRTPRDTADHFGLSVEEVASMLDKGIHRLQSVRLQRPKPHLDDKIVTCWNGLMVSGLAKAAAAFGHDGALEMAKEAVNFIRKEMLIRDGSNVRLLRSYRDGPSAVEGFADDYAFLVQGLLDLFELTQDEALLDLAVELQRTQDALFWDDQSGGYFTSAEGDKTILVRMKGEFDGAEPSVNSISVSNMCRLFSLRVMDDGEDRARKVVMGCSESMEKMPLGSGQLLAAWMDLDKGFNEIVIVRPTSQTDVEAWTNAVNSRYIPNKTIRIVTGEDSEGRCCVDGKVSAFLCRNKACGLPLTTVDAFADALTR